MTTYSEPDTHIDELANTVIGAAAEVHRVLGPGFVESAYEEARAVELSLRSVPFERQKLVPIHYKGRLIGEARLDLLVGQRLIVELKAVQELNELHMAQVISYLKATKLLLSLLINFNVPLLKDGIRRVILS